MAASLEEHPEYDLLPSEYFRRQIYGCFWYERETITTPALLAYPDNMMFETDFPHPTCQHPGPRTPAVGPEGRMRRGARSLCLTRCCRRCSSPMPPSSTELRLERHRRTRWRCGWLADELGDQPVASRTCDGRRPDTPGRTGCSTPDVRRPRGSRSSRGGTQRGACSKPTARVEAAVLRALQGTDRSRSPAPLGRSHGPEGWAARILVMDLARRDVRRLRPQR